MLRFKNFLRESRKANTLVMHYGRMNPVTRGHEENVNSTVSMARRAGADHVIVASHSQDAQKNPLSSTEKLKHLKRAFPGVNVQVADKSRPTIMHHAEAAHKAGYEHLVVTAGEDRIPEYTRLLNRYNGQADRSGKVLYNFKSIKVVSTGERKEGVSGTDMRNHAKQGNFDKFREGLPSRLSNNESHARDIYNETRKGMGIG
jgi:hypothetical protein